jgi:hypothetical protein
MASCPQKAEGYTSWGWLEKPLPKVDPSKGFGVAVAHLENDENHEFEHLICVQLEKMKDFQVVRFDRKILVSSLDQGSALGHDKARRFLEESGAHVLPRDRDAWVRLRPV